jgi:predicted nucleic acid-binding protein
MAVVFFDTSALVRRYSTHEPGSGRVRTLCRAAARHTLVVSFLARIEVASAFNRRAREGDLDLLQRDHRWRIFRRHLLRQYRVITLDERIYQRAERLLFSHPLRAFDALQIASALLAAGLFASLTPDLRFCTADQAQAQAASREGLAIEFIS